MSDQPILDALADLDRRRGRGRTGPAPHQPLLLLLGVERVVQGEARLMRFDLIEPRLKALIEQFGGKVPAETHLPWCHLPESLWEFADRGRFGPGDVHPKKPRRVKRAALVRGRAEGGLAESVFLPLAADPSLRAQVVDALVGMVSDDAQQVRACLVLERPRGGTDDKQTSAQGCSCDFEVGEFYRVLEESYAQTDVVECQCGEGANVALEREVEVKRQVLEHGAADSWDVEEVEDEEISVVSQSVNCPTCARSPGRGARQRSISSYHASVLEVGCRRCRLQMGDTRRQELLTLVRANLPDGPDVGWWS